MCRGHLLVCYMRFNSRDQVYKVINSRQRYCFMQLQHLEAASACCDLVYFQIKDLRHVYCKLLGLAHPDHMHVVFEHLLEGICDAACCTTISLFTYSEWYSRRLAASRKVRQQRLAHNVRS